MIFDSILPEIYTFIDFTKHRYFLAQKNGEHSLLTHFAGEIPKVHPMPYNVYVPIREFLYENPKAIEPIMEYIDTEFKNRNYNFKNVEVSSSVFTEKKSFGRSKKYPQINVKLDW